MKNRIRMGQYTFPNPEWQNVSHDAKDLINGMLNIDPAKRLTIDQVMSNRWIAVSIFIIFFKCLTFFNFKAIYSGASNTFTYPQDVERR